MIRTMPDDLYQRDVLIWAEQQADLLRRLSLGECVNAQIDWPHVIEELHDPAGGLTTRLVR